MEAKTDERFGRAQYFVLYDEVKRTAKTIENSAKHESGGAGGTAVRLLSEQGVNVVLVPELGPKAMDAMRAFDLKAYRYEKAGSVQETVDAYLAGDLEAISTNTTGSKHGLRRV